MTLSIEPVIDYGDPPRLIPEAVQRAFDQISKLFLDAGGRSLRIRVGTSSVTYTASQNSAAVTVTHGLGTTPVVVLVGMRAANNVSSTFPVTATSATDFTYQGRAPEGVATATQNTYWIAIG